MKTIRLYILSFLLITIYVSKAQNQASKTDSLIIELNNSLKEEDQLKILSNLVLSLRFTDPNQAHEFALKRLDYSLDLNLKEDISYSYILLGIIFEELEKYEDALHNYLRSLDIINDLSDKKYYPTALICVGNIYNRLQLYDNALEYYKKSLQFYFDSGDVNNINIASCYQNMGVIYYEKNNMDSAIYYYEKGIIIYLEARKYYEIAITLNNIGGVLFQQKKYTEAIQKYRESKVILDSIYNEIMIIKSYYNLSEVYYELALFDSADYYINKAINVGLDKKLTDELASSYQLKSKIKEKENKPIEALNYYKKYIILNDSIKTKSTYTKIIEMESKYKFERSQKEITLLSQENKIQSLQLRNNTYIILVTIVVMFIIIMVILFLVQKNKFKTQKRVNKLEQKLLSSQMNPHFMFNVLNAIQESILKEDKMIVYQYHSKFSKLLRLILLHSREDLISLKEDIQALKLYIELEQFRTDNGFNYKIQIDDDIDDYECKIPPMLIQPYVENAIWHGVLPLKDKKGEILIQVKIRDHKIYCKIEDNGVGRAISSLEKKNTFKKQKSVGMDVTRERLELHNLKNNEKLDYIVTDLENNEGKPAGTRVEIIISKTKKK